MIITKPGLYDMPAEAYHADPCDPMSISASGIRTITDTCPAKFDWQRRNRTNKRCFDIGTAAHLMILEPDQLNDRIVVVQGFTKDGKPSDGYSSTAAKEQRQAAYDVGKTPLLQAELDRIKAMRAALWNDPIAKLAFVGGLIEQSIFWRDDEFGIWCRTRPDFISKNGRYAINYKTAASADPADFQKALHNMGYHQKCAWEMEGLAAVGRQVERFAFVVQEKEAPFLVSVHWIEPLAQHYGDLENRRGKAIFAKCLRDRSWPSYRPDPLGPAAAFSTGLPDWLLRQYEARADAGAFDIQPERDAA